MAKLKILITLLAVFGAASITRADESKRGFFEGSLSGGGRIVFFVQANHSVSAYIFNTAGQQASFAGGPVGDNGAFSLTTSANQSLTGTVNSTAVTATFVGQSITANRVSAFGPSREFAGRFTTTASSSGGTSVDVKIVIDAQNNIFLITKQGSTVLGGFGQVSGVTHQANREDEAGDDHGGRGRHGDEDDDEAEDHHEDDNAASFTANFTVTFVTGQVVTGHLVFSHETLLGDFTINGVTFNFRAAHEAAANRLANISTRGFVNTGEGQLIGGFIISGGPKLVVIRAIGPSLAQFGINQPLANPVLRLFDRSTPLRENDNWQSAANANELTATGFAPTNPNEAALLIRLEPGQYTTIVSGANNTTGIALVEVYELGHD